MRIEEQKRLNDLKERMLLEQAEVQARSEAEKRDQSARHERESKVLHEKIENYIQSNHEHLDKNMKSTRAHELAYDEIQEIKRSLEVENREQR